MWTCPECNESHEDQFKSCWKCAKTDAGAETSAMACLRCFEKMAFAGTRKFPEGFQFTILDTFPSALGNTESFDLYVCPRCGRVEFFDTGIGEEFRSK